MNMADASSPDRPVWQADRLAGLLGLARAAREASSSREIAFLLVNETHGFVPYRQACFWLRDRGIQALSGVLLPDANVPHAQWLAEVCGQLADGPPSAARALTSAALPPALAAAWDEWWPRHALWLPLPAGAAEGALLLARDEPWTPEEQRWLREWADIAWHAYQGRRQSEASSLESGWRRLRRAWAAGGQGPAWKRPAWRIAAAAAVALALPVRLTVLAPGELVPAHPTVIRSPLEGVIDTFHVQPNQAVTAGQALLGFDEALIAAKLRVAEQSFETAATEYRQAAQQALADARYRPQLAQLTGRIEERRAEAAYLREQLQRARVLAPAAGVVLMDDPGEWVGKPVTVGERILRIATPGDVEVEAWLPLGDGIALPPGASITLHLDASPLAPVAARLRTLAHEAVQRPDGTFAYRVRAVPEGPTEHRVGLKGTARIAGERVPLGYWILRRPLAWVRSTLGL